MAIQEALTELSKVFERIPEVGKVYIGDTDAADLFSSPVVVIVGIEDEWFNLISEEEDFFAYQAELTAWVFTSSSSLTVAERMSVEIIEKLAKIWHDAPNDFLRAADGVLRARFSTGDKAELDATELGTSQRCIMTTIKVPVVMSTREMEMANG